MKNITIPAPVFEKLAAFVAKVPEVTDGLEAEIKASKAKTSKSASDNVKVAAEVKRAALAAADELVKHAGLDPAKKQAFADSMLTPENAIKVISVLATKIASEKARADKVAATTLGGPSVKEASNGAAQTARQAWVSNLLG